MLGALLIKISQRSCAGKKELPQGGTHLLARIYVKADCV
eukprot:CAMPEP_0206261536 /NCGR_PEP_ID=MMETSP0047_2-20121206/27711_1 /ASSEMBLY_ACC=CAM_ASM_000192 /TAXON_ID=195065 /ORGANISM="Chroomonas mesostigmatica_cf, Strain CCMP1168" /LENGTH=38 /DNA_ID= /DNA_START= /DNA_END= /DNA_ORIENTATION=